MSLYYNLYYEDESMSLDQFREYMTSRRYNDILEIKDSSDRNCFIFTMSTPQCEYRRISSNHRDRR